MNNLFTQILSDYPQEEVSLIVGEPSPAWNNLENKDIDLNPIKKLFRNKIIE